MAKWIKTKAAGLLFAAAAAVYSDGLVRAMAASSADPDAPRSPADAIRARAASKSADLADKANARTAAANGTSRQATASASKPAAEKPADKTTATAKTEEAEKPVDPFADAPTPVAPTPIASASAAEPLTQANVNVSDAGLVEIHVNDANLGEVLRMLSLQLERNIMASKEVRGTVTANLYDVTVKEALEAICAPTSAATARRATSSTSTRRRNSIRSRRTSGSRSPRPSACSTRPRPTR
jgi:hypothetical protein